MCATFRASGMALVAPETAAGTVLRLPGRLTGTYFSCISLVFAVHSLGALGNVNCMMITIDSANK